MKQRIVLAMSVAMIVGLSLACSGKIPGLGRSSKGLLAGSWRGEVDGKAVTYTFEKGGDMVMTVAVDRAGEPPVRLRGKYRWLDEERLEIEMPEVLVRGVSRVVVRRITFPDPDTLVNTDPQTGIVRRYQRLKQQ